MSPGILLSSLFIMVIGNLINYVTIWEEEIRHLFDDIFGFYTTKNGECTGKVNLMCHFYEYNFVKINFGDRYTEKYIFLFWNKIYFPFLTTRIKKMEMITCKDGYYAILSWMQNNPSDKVYSNLLSALLFLFFFLSNILYE